MGCEVGLNKALVAFKPKKIALAGRHGKTFFLRLDVDDMDSENSVSMTWSIDPSGTMRHRKTGTKVSTEDGITLLRREKRRLGLVGGVFFLGEEGSFGCTLYAAWS